MGRRFMEIYYSSIKQERMLTDMRLLKKYYSNDYAKISNRLSELRAANNLNEIPDVPPPKRHKLTGNWKNCWGINYSKNDRIVICPEGEYDINNLTTIRAVKILELEDYH